MLIINDRRVKKLLPYIWVIFIVFGIIDYLFITTFKTLNPITASVQSVLIISMCFFYFFDQLRQTNSILIYSSVNFWIVISFLIYVAGTFFLFILADNMIRDKSFFAQYVIINASFNILKNILLSVAMTMKSSKLQSDELPHDILNESFPDINTLKNLN